MVSTSSVCSECGQQPHGAQTPRDMIVCKLPTACHACSSCTGLHGKVQGICGLFMANNWSCCMCMCARFHDSSIGFAAGQLVTSE
jgi:hypothetical protein